MYLPNLPIHNWFFGQNHKVIEHFNQHRVLQIYKRLDFEQVKSAFTFICSTHPVFYCNFLTLGGEKQQILRQDFQHNLSFHLYDAALKDKDLDQYIQLQISKHQQKMNLEKGPIFIVLYFTCYDTSYIAVLAHHLYVDNVSWIVLFSQLEEYFKGKVINILPPKIEDSYIKFCKAVKEYNIELLRPESIAYWNNTLSKFQIESKLDYNALKKLSFKESKHYKATLLVDNLKYKVSCLRKNHNIEFQDILISAVAKAFLISTSSKQVSINIESHGRFVKAHNLSLIDLVDSVGWYTNFCPIVIDDEENLLDFVSNVTKLRKKSSNHMLEYMILTYRDKKLTQTFSSINFNFHGIFEDNISSNNIFSVLELENNSDINLDNFRYHDYDINILIRNNNIIIYFWCSNQYPNDEANNILFLIQEQIIQILSDYETAGEYYVECYNQEKQEAFKLSDTQKGILYSCLLGPHKTYIINSLYKISSHNLDEIDYEILRESWRYVLSHYSILQHKFIIPREGEPLQLPTSVKDLNWYDIDYTNSNIKGCDYEKLSYKILDYAPQAIALNKSPLIQVKLYRISKKTALICITFNHLIMDGWCNSILLNSFIKAYKSLSRNQQPNLGNSYDYRTYLSILEKVNTKKAETFWQKYVSALSPTCFNSDLYFEIDREYNVNFWNIDTLFYKRIQSCIKKYRVTFNSFFMTVFALLLSVMLRKNKICYGLTLSGRYSTLEEIDLEQLANSIGLFIKVLPINIDLTNNELTLESIITNCFNNCLLLQEHSEYPIRKIINSAVEQKILNKRRQPLFDATLTFQNYPLQLEEDILKFDHIDTREFNEYTMSITIIPQLDSFLIRLIFLKRLEPIYPVKKIEQYFNVIVRLLLEGPDYKKVSSLINEVINECK